MKKLAIIPARSGSKGLQDKNIKLLNGKPLMAYSIEAALQAGVFDEVMVSTDSRKYAEIAQKYGATVPFLRSEANSCDKASSWDMVDEVLDFYQKNEMEFDSFCLLQPTSPLRDFRDIREAYALYEKETAAAVVSICEVEHSPLWCGILRENNSLENFILKNNIEQRQSLKQYYRINGAIYIVRTEEFYRDRFLYRKGSYGYIMSKEKSIDIDTLQDFLYAEFLMGVHSGKIC